MEVIEYVGEHLWLGKLGHFLMVFSFVASIVSAFSYWRYQQNINKDLDPNNSGWLSLGRSGFLIHAIATFTIIGLILYAMVHEWYEYAYVYDHVNQHLPRKYIMSAFWEGQEGSFQLWMVWNVILGLIIMARRGEWEAPVLAVVALFEVFLVSMLLGIHIEVGDFIYKMGISPFVLLRDTMDIPLFTNAEYLSLVEGRGLNPLLQNYWNVIHPPMTFLGFASVTFPFAFAIAGLWTGKHREWLKPGLRWGLFSGAVLGLGIWMGSVWAYEALSFGGYWAWDPVENGILVPWLILIAGIHTNLIARNSPYSIKSTYFMYLLSGVLVIYSAFLTRSGILGDTSAHAFTQLGLEWQLVAFVVVFALLSFGLLIAKRNKISTPSEEEKLNSREFWMLIGSLVLLFSGVLIIGSTSLPVYNTIRSAFDENFVGRVIEEKIAHYDRYQLWIAVFMAVLTAIAQFLRYGSSSKWGKVLPRLGVAAVLAIVCTYLTTFWIDFPLWQHWLMAWAGWFTMWAHLDYLIFKIKGNLKLGASALSHFGFGLMLIGILASGTNKSHLSSNPFMFRELLSKEEAMKYVKLYKGKPLFANNYWMTYESDTLIGRDRYYNVKFEEVGPGEEIIDSFTVRPTSMLSNDFTEVKTFNPDTEHKWTKDIFTNVIDIPMAKRSIENLKKLEDTMVWTNYDLSVGETIETKTSKITLNKLHFSPDRPDYAARDHDIGIGADFTIVAKRRMLDSVEQVSPALGLEGNLLYSYPNIMEEFRMRVKLRDSLMDRVYLPVEEFKEELFKVRRGEAFEYKGRQITLQGFENSVEDARYTKQEGDIAVTAQMELRDGEERYTAKPMYIIRGNKPFSIQDMASEAGLGIRLLNIQPEEETFEFGVAEVLRSDVRVPIMVAEDLPESNFIWFEARVFPGINLFWLGTVLMLLGLLVGWLRRRAVDR